MADITTGLLERVRERLTACIRPNAPRTPEALAAFERAVRYQAEYETVHADALEAARRGVQSFSAGSYSETYFAPQGGDGASALCPEARAALLNGGLLARTLPCAQRL